MEADKRGTSVGPLQKRQEMMEDGHRHIIYFTFGETRGGVRRREADDQETEDV